jgi:hypothetical protein
MKVDANEISEETRQIFKKELGDNAEKKLPNSINSNEFIRYLRNRFKNCADGIQFKEGKKHTLASVDGGKAWILLAGRHPSQVINEHTAQIVLRQLNISRMLVIQGQQKELSLDTTQNNILRIGEKIVYRFENKKSKSLG